MSPSLSRACYPNLSFSIRTTPTATLGIHPVKSEELVQLFRLCSGVMAEIIAAYEVRLCGFVAGGQVVAEAISYGSPEGIMVRVTLTQPGMRHEVWEQPVPAGYPEGVSTIGGLVKRFWEDPMGTAIVPARR